MNARFRTTCAAALIAVGGLATMLPAAHAQGSQYQADRATCDGVQQDRQACIREAGAAAQAARNHTLTSASPEVYRENALQRCTLQPPSDRAACEQRVLGTGNTTINGSVMGGGAIRETVTQVPVNTMPAPVSTRPMPMPPPGSAMPMQAPPTVAPSYAPMTPAAPIPPAAPAPMVPLTPR